jgi:hypothetical protein
MKKDSGRRDAVIDGDWRRDCKGLELGSTLPWECIISGLDLSPGAKIKYSIQLNVPMSLSS